MMQPIDRRCEKIADLTTALKQDVAFLNGNTRARGVTAWNRMELHRAKLACERAAADLAELCAKSAPAEEVA